MSRKPTGPIQPNTPAVRERIRSRMAAKGISQKELARRATLQGAVKVTESQISKILTARQKWIGEDHLRSLGHVLGVDLVGIAAQTILQLDIAEDFFAQAVLAIDEHILRASADLGDEASSSRLLFGEVSLRVVDEPRSRVFEKAFPIAPMAPVRRIRRRNRIAQ